MADDKLGGTQLRTAQQGLRALVRSDAHAMAKLKGGSGAPAGRLDVWSLPGTWAVLLVRLANACHDTGLRPLSRLLYFLNCVVFGCDVQPGVRLGPGAAFAHPLGVCISSSAVIGADFRAMGNVRIGGAASEDPAHDGAPVIGDGCWFLDGAKAFGPIVLGDRMVLASSAVATTDLPAEVWAAGVPARVIKPRAAFEGAA